jgi:rhodanese-related sulfurtransferase
MEQDTMAKNKARYRGKKKTTTKKTFPVWGWIALAAVVVVVIGVFVLQGSKPTAAVALPASEPTSTDALPASEPTSTVDLPSSQPTSAVDFPSQITAAQAAEKRDQGAFILDVREPDEWAQMHIPGATLIPLGELPDRLNEIPKDKEIVVVCRSGNRSARGRDILLNAGFTNVTSMTGGMTQWQAQGFPVATGE